jgi:hypothetical protein
MVFMEPLILEVLMGNTLVFLFVLSPFLLLAFWMLSVGKGVDWDSAGQ